MYSNWDDLWILLSKLYVRGAEKSRQIKLQFLSTSMRWDFFGGVPYNYRLFLDLLKMLGKSKQIFSQKVV